MSHHVAIIMAWVPATLTANTYKPFRAATASPFCRSKNKAEKNAKYAQPNMPIRGTPKGPGPFQDHRPAFTDIVSMSEASIPTMHPAARGIYLLLS